MDCLKPVRLTKNLDPRVYPRGIEVPCGKCMNCRIQRRREWTLRLTHELEYYQKATFLTLTYSDEYLPLNPLGPIPASGTLRKTDLQKFWKRLRKTLSKGSLHGKYYGPHPIRRIRYYACGEYGDKNDRPHYHAIVFGINPEGSDKASVMDAWPYCDWSQKKIIEGSFGTVTPSSISYVASYINKKLSGSELEKKFTSIGREPVFKTSSLGIGREWCNDHEDQLSEEGEIRSWNGSVQTIPRYYLKRLPWRPPDRQDELKEKEREWNQSIVGVYMTDEELYDTELASEAEQARASKRLQTERTHNAKVTLYKRKL